MVAVSGVRLRQLPVDSTNRQLTAVHWPDSVHTATVQYTAEHHKVAGMLHNFQLRLTALSRQRFVVSILFCCVCTAEYDGMVKGKREEKKNKKNRF